MRAVVDIETGGFDLKNHAIVEIGILVINDEYKVVDEFCKILNPYLKQSTEQFMEYTEEAEKIHGISESDIKAKGIDANKVCDAIDLMIEKHSIDEWIGHNAKKFDMPRIIHLFEQYSMFETLSRFDEVTDTLIWSRNILQHFEKHSLKHLCAMLDIVNPDPHRAIGDCYATLELLKILEQ